MAQIADDCSALSKKDRSGSIYSFGETDQAAERLRVVAQVFEPTSEALVSETVLDHPRLTLDLGCGPGFTTRLLSRVARSARTVGIDRSEPFLSRARASSVAREEYIAADLAVTSLRSAGIGAPPDLIYMRFLASHLPEPVRAISGWAKELEPGGLLLAEEVDSISTKVAVFEEYLKIVSQMLAWYGNELFVGARLGANQWNTDLSIVINRATEVRPTTGDAARMFSLNISNWRRDPYVEAVYPSDKLESLTTELDGLIDSTETGQITWQIRQICLRRK